MKVWILLRFIRREVFKSEHWGSDHMTQRVNEQIGAFPAIEPESHLVQIGRKVLGTDLMPTTNDAALEQRERRFYGVCRDASAVLVSRIFLGGMVDSLMWQATNSTGICSQIVGDNHFYILTDVFADVLCESTGTGVSRVKEPQIAVPLPDTDNNFLRRESGFLAPSLFSTAYIGFVHLDSTVKHGLVYFFHSCTDAMTEIPRGFVGASVKPPDRALELVGAHALLSFAEQQHRHKPDRQGQVGIVEDRPSCDGELITALTASELLARVNPPHIAVLATRTFDTFWPAELSEDFAAIFVGRERLIQFRERHG